MLQMILNKEVKLAFLFLVDRTRQVNLIFLKHVKLPIFRPTKTKHET